MRLFFVLLTMAAIAPISSCSRDAASTDSAINQTHEFRLVVVSSGEDDVPIQGSIAFDTDGGGYVHISGSTPYEITVHGRSIIAIVNSSIVGAKIDAILNVDGSTAISGEDDQTVVFGRDMPKQHSGFAISL